MLDYGGFTVAFRSLDARCFYMAANINHTRISHEDMTLLHRMHAAAVLSYPNSRYRYVVHAA